MVVYKATFENGKSYIGCTIQPLEKRQNNHKYEASNNRSNMLFHKAIRKYGWNKLRWEVVYETNDFQDLLNAEVRLIAEQNTLLPNGYNITSGGSGVLGFKNPSKGQKRTQATKDKMSKAKDRFKKRIILFDTVSKVEYKFESIKSAKYSNISYNSFPY